jgi:hypothetical protein
MSSPAVCQLGIEPSRAMRVLKYLSQVAVLPTMVTPSPSTAAVLESEQRWGVHHHLAALCRIRMAHDATSMKDMCDVLGYLRASAEVALRPEERSEEVRADLRRLWATGVLALPAAAAGGSVMDRWWLRAELARASPTPEERTNAFTALACDMLQADDAAAGSPDWASIVLESCIASAPNGVIPEVVRSLIMGCVMGNVRDLCRCVVHLCGEACMTVRTLGLLKKSITPSIIAPPTVEREDEGASRKRKDR